MTPRSPSGVRDVLSSVAPYAFVLIWSSSFVTARIGLRLVTPLLFVAVRLVVAAVILMAAMVVRRESWAPLRGRWYHLMVAGALVNGLTLAAFHVGMVTVDAAVMALVQAMSPLLIALLGRPLLGERLRRRQWLGILVGFAGMLLVVGRSAAHSHAELAAVLLGSSASSASPEARSTSAAGAAACHCCRRPRSSSRRPRCWCCSRCCSSRRRGRRGAGRRWRRLPGTWSSCRSAG